VSADDGRGQTLIVSLKRRFSVEKSVHVRILHTHLDRFDVNQGNRPPRSVRHALLRKRAEGKHGYDLEYQLRMKAP
jgi:hypothetical protein